MIRLLVGLYGLRFLGFGVQGFGFGFQGLEGSGFQ